MRFERETKRFPGEKTEPGFVNREVIETYFNNEDMRAVVSRTYDGSDEWWSTETTTDIGPSEFTAMAGNIGDVYADSEARFRYDRDQDEEGRTHFMLFSGRRTDILKDYDIIRVERGPEGGQGAVTYIQRTANPEYDHVLKLRGGRDDSHNFVEVLNQAPVDRDEAEAIFEAGKADLEKLDYNHYDL